MKFDVKLKPRSDGLVHRCGRGIWLALALRCALSLISAGLVVVSVADSQAARSDYKSDLELDIDENGNEAAPQTETLKARPQITKPSAQTTGHPDVESRIDLAQSQMERKLYDEVIQTLIPVNDVLPRTGLLLLAKAYAEKRDKLNELKTLELCIAKNTKDYVVQTAYGRALIRAKRVEDGIAAYQEARKLNPRYRPAYDALLTELELKGERYEARNVVEDMRKYFGDQPRLFTALCRLYAADSYHEKTIEVCEKAIEKDPSVAENSVYLGVALMNREKMDRAHAVLIGAARRFPASEPVQSALGELALNKKDTVNAYNYYRHATAADPKSIRAWNGLGFASFRLQKFAVALKAFVTACRLDRLESQDVRIGREVTREFRLAIGELRVRKDVSWQSRFEAGVNECQ